MVLVKTEQTEEQTNNEKAREGELHKSITDTLKDTNVMGDVLKDLGLSPEAEENKEEKPAVRKLKVPENEEIQEEQLEEEDTSEEQQEEDEEEVIPKSKVQKRFDELTARLKAQEKELEQLKLSKAEPKDEVTRQLESMTTEQLKAAKLEVRKAQIKSQDNDAQLNELIALEDKINAQLENAPKNFANAQKEAYVKKAVQLAESGEIPDVEKNAPIIMKLANDLYQEYPMLQKDINGQAIALDLAVKHFKAINSVPGDKTKESELKRQVNNLKRKTTLDTKSGKSNSDKVRLDTLKKNAMGGSMQNKVDLVRSHPMFNVDKMIPDEFKQ